MRSFALAPLLLLAALARADELPAETSAPLRPGLAPGESLTFQAKWGLFPRAGRVVVSASEDTGPGEDDASGEGDGEVVLIRLEVASDGTLGRLFRFQAEADSRFDGETGRMLSAVMRSAQGSKKTERRLTFDYEAGIARYEDKLEPRRSEELTLPEDGRPMDLISCLVSARQWKLQPGDEREILVMADKRFYPMRLKAMVVERHSFPLGEFDALLLVPEPIGEARGVFRDGGGIRVWVENSERGLPLRIEVKTRVGLVVADLVEYRPPGEDVAPEDILRPPVEEEPVRSRARFRKR